MVNAKPCHDRFIPGSNPLPTTQEDGWASGPISRGAENLAPIGVRSPDRPVCSYPSLPDTDTITISATNDCVLTCNTKTRRRSIGVSHDSYFRNDQLILANLNEALRHSALFLFEIGIMFSSGVASASFLLGSDTTSTIVGLPTEVHTDRNPTNCLHKKYQLFEE